LKTKLKKLQTILDKSDLKYDAMELADALWLAQYDFFFKKTIIKEEISKKQEDKSTEKTEKQKSKKQSPKETNFSSKVKKILIETESLGDTSVHVSTKSTKRSGLSINIKQFSSTLNQNKLYNALKNFRQKKVSTTKFKLDIKRIVDTKADTNLFIPYYKPEYENRFELVILIDSSDTMELWSEETEKFANSIKNFNLFKSVHKFYLDSSKEKPNFFTTKNKRDKGFHISHYLKTDTLVMIVSDMTAPSWRSGKLLKKLYKWQDKVTISMIQMFSSHLWNRTVLKDSDIVRFQSNRNKRFNSTLKSDVDDMLEFLDSDFEKRKLLKLPISTMELNSLEALSKVITGKANSSISGAIICVDDIKTQEKIELTDSERVSRFYENSSKIAHQLAHYLSVVPLDINVMKLIQKLMIKNSSKIHLSEILTGGIIKKDDELYHFYHKEKNKDGIREIFLNQLGTSNYLQTIKTLSNYVENNLDIGFSAYFQAILKDSETNEIGKLSRLDTEFAHINIKRLKRFGGKFEKLAKRLTVEIEAIVPKSKRFQMGSNDGEENEKPVHEIIINYDFEIAKHPVTVGEFRVFVKDTNYKTEAEKGYGAYIWDGRDWNKKKDAYWDNPYFKQTDKHPVVCVSWNDAKEYIEWLNEKTKEEYRLPTEAEWEYVACAGTTTKWSFGDNEKELEKYAWYDEKGGKGTHPVGKKLPNPWELYDIHGNVWEWCEDWYDKYKDTKVLRGGSWYEVAFRARSAIRNWSSPTYRSDDVGFRLLRTLPS